MYTEGLKKLLAIRWTLTRTAKLQKSDIIRFAISHYRGQMSEVARKLKIGRSTLYRKLDENADHDQASSRGGTD